MGINILKRILRRFGGKVMVRNLTLEEVKDATILINKIIRDFDSIEVRCNFVGTEVRNPVRSFDPSEDE